MNQQPRQRRPRSGLTLFELLVALTAGATILLSAVQLAGSISLTSRKLELLSGERMRRANALTWLRNTLATAERSTIDQPFRGREHELEFVVPREARDDGGGGRVRIVVDRGVLIAVTDRGTRMVLRTGVKKLTVDYLGQRGRTAPWLPSWESEHDLPAAIRLRLAMSDGSVAVDTLLFSIRTTL